MSKPTLIAINHDDYHASHVGKLPDDRQFFATSPFVPAVRGDGREFIAVFLFDKDGHLLEARIDDLGVRAELDPMRAKSLFDLRISELGPVRYERIEVRPFELERFGVGFGLIIRNPEEEGEDWWVELQPGNYMAFHEPWDSGDYDT
ncbi:MAG TPA: hypothetical protein VMF06_00015 [Candidatus Limnocylindria bacterium]|jgi:hypothetical protein|nr:hypothetical protein [Candidatus Limnocylindria bacterium]